MQEFCPQCAENGQENKIKAFQINYTEAVFMCSNVECTWPAGHQELTFINRQVGKEHSRNWEKMTKAHIKTEQDRSLEFQPYTPPRTPSSFPDIMSIPMEDIIFLSDDQEFPSSFIKPCNTIVDSAASNKGKSKPKVLSIQTVTNMQPTSLANKPVLIKTGKITLGPPVVKQVKIEPKESSRMPTRSRKIGHPYKKFSLNDLSKTKDKDVNKVPESNVIKLEEAEVKVQDCLNELSTITNNVNSSNLVGTIVDISEGDGAALDSTLTLKTSNPKDTDIEKMDDDVLDIKVPESNVIKVEEAEIKVEDCLNESSTITNNVNSSNLVSTIVDISKDNGAALDSKLSKTSNPKDPSDIEMIDDDVLDIGLNEIWEMGLSNDIEGTFKSELDSSDEWVNSLFES